MLITNKNQQRKITKYLYNVKKRSDTQIETPSVNIQDAPLSRHSYRSHSNQSIGYNKESSDWYLHDSKEHKEEQDLCGNYTPTVNIFGFLFVPVDCLDIAKVAQMV